MLLELLKESSKTQSSLIHVLQSEPREVLNLHSGIFEGGVPRKWGGFSTRVRGTMSACRVRRDIVPSCKCDYPPLAHAVSKCAQHLLDSTVAVRRGQSVIVPSSPEARDCHVTLVSVPPVSSCPIHFRDLPQCNEFPQGQIGIQSGYAGALFGVVLQQQQKVLS